MDNQVRINNNELPMWKGDHRISLVCVILIFAGMACVVSKPATPTPRDFTTAALMIDPSLLPPEWETVEGPNPERSDFFGVRNLGATYILVKDSESNFDHIVAIFPNSQDAARAYNDHDFTRDTLGKFARTWISPTGFAYCSPIADQFRVVCVEIKNKAEIGEIGEGCAVEAQYEEFVSLLIYRTSNSDKINTDLELLATAIDSQIIKFLGD